MNPNKGQSLIQYIIENAKKKIQKMHQNKSEKRSNKRTKRNKLNKLKSKKEKKGRKVVTFLSSKLLQKFNQSF